MELPPFPTDQPFQDQLEPAKKRRVPGACDACKRRKIRCDSAERPGNKCSYCIRMSLECMHTEVGKTLGSARRYVESLEGRLDKMDRLFNKLLPGLDVNIELEKLTDEGISDDNPQYAIPRNDEVASDLVSHLAQLGILDPQRDKFFGKSSNLSTIKTAMQLKLASSTQVASAPETWQRRQYWETPEWALSGAIESTSTSDFEYPDEDLMAVLIDLYFSQLNALLPLLHRPIFEQSVKQGLHLRDLRFGATVLLVCAHGARYSDDPRVLMDGSDWSSAGWYWYQQVRPMGHQIPEKCSLYDAQSFFLICLYGIFSMIPQNCCLQAGVGLKLMVEVGAHVQSKAPTPTTENELWKRAFWCLYFLDTRYSSAYGRSPTMRTEDFNLDHPVECDDEHWDEGFRQPLGKPSRITYFNLLIKATTIMNEALQALYSLKRPQNPVIKTLRTEQECVIELNTILNEWLTSLPPHLRRGSTIQDEIFRSQSLYLHISFYHYMLVIHRPFIPSPTNPIPGPLPSLAICSNVGKNCCSLFTEARTRRNDKRIMMVTADTVFTVGLTLVLCLLSQPGSSDDDAEEGVRRCSALLGDIEQRVSLAGRQKDVLDNLYGNRMEGSDRSKCSRAQSSVDLAQMPWDPASATQSPYWHSDRYAGPSMPTSSNVSHQTTLIGGQQVGEATPSDWEAFWAIPLPAPPK